MYKSEDGIHTYIIWPAIALKPNYKAEKRNVCSKTIKDNWKTLPTINCYLNWSYGAAEGTNSILDIINNFDLCPSFICLQMLLMFLHKRSFKSVIMFRFRTSNDVGGLVGWSGHTQTANVLNISVTNRFFARKLNNV